MDKHQKTLLASEFLKKLATSIDEHGDRPIYLDDPDTGWLLGVDIGASEETYGHMSEPPDYFLITARYATGWHEA